MPPEPRARRTHTVAFNRVARRDMRDTRCSMCHGTVRRAYRPRTCAHRVCEACARRCDRCVKSAWNARDCGARARPWTIERAVADVLVAYPSRRALGIRIARRAVMRMTGKV